MPEITVITRRDLLVLTLILLIAGLLRFGQAGIVEFFHDDAMLSSLAQRMVAGDYFPVTGINSSVGIPNPPISVYVMAIPFFINRNPMTAIWFIMGLNVIGVGLLWWIAHRYFGRTVALVAGLAYALNPWAILYSRKIWAQDYHTPFVLLGILLGLYGFWERRLDDGTTNRIDSKVWAQALCLPVLLCAFQIHFAAWALLPIYLALVVPNWRRISWRAMAVTVILSVLVMAPYGIGIYQTALRNPSQVNPDAVGTLADTERAFSDLSLRYLAFLGTGFGLETWLAPQQQAEMNQHVAPTGLWLILGGFILLGTLLLGRKRWRWAAILLLLWAYLPAIALIPQWAGVYPHYFIASIPALMLLMGLGVAQITDLVPLQSFGRTLVLVAFAFILLTQAMYWRGALRYVDSRALNYPAFTTPMHYLQEVEAAIGDADDVVVLSDGMAWDLHHESVVWSVMLADSVQCVRTLIGDRYAVFPSGNFVALEAPNMPENALNNLYATDDPHTIAIRAGDKPYRVHQWAQAPTWQGIAIQPIAPYRFGGDVTLTGYGIDMGAVVLEWSLPQAQVGLNYQWSIQPYDASGTRLGQSDTSFWQGRHWCEGDRLLTWQWYALPADTAAIHVILYELGTAQGPRYINATIQNAEGQSVDAAVIPLP